MNTKEITKEKPILKEVVNETSIVKLKKITEENPDTSKEYAKRIYQKHIVFGCNSNECKLCYMDRYKS